VPKKANPPKKQGTPQDHAEFLAALHVMLQKLVLIGICATIGIALNKGRTNA
jgi:hypothetical protein